MQLTPVRDLHLLMVVRSLGPRAPSSTEEESAMRRMTAAHGLRWRLPRRRCARLGWGWEWGSARLLLSMFMVISEGGNRYSRPSTDSSVPAPRAIGSSPSSFPRSTPQRLIVPCRLGNADGRLAGAHASQVRFASAPPTGTLSVYGWTVSSVRPRWVNGLSLAALRASGSSPSLT